MSCPQPTAQYGQTPSVTTAPRSREALAAVCGLKGCCRTRRPSAVSMRSRWNTCYLPGKKLERRERPPLPGYGGFAQPDAGGAGVGVEVIGADEAEQGEPVLAGQLHGQAGGGADGGEDRDSRHRRLLHQLEAGPAADEQDPVVQWGAAGEELAADELVQGVVPADVLA